MTPEKKQKFTDYAIRELDKLDDKLRGKGIVLSLACWGFCGREDFNVFRSTSAQDCLQKLLSAFVSIAQDESAQPEVTLDRGIKVLQEAKQKLLDTREQENQTTKARETGTKKEQER